MYKVVDGKQRLTTLLDFVRDRIQVPEDFPNTDLRELVFNQLANEQKLEVWRYLFSIEFIEQENEAVINDIFNRINKNVARLTPQELRHAKFSGAFISAAEGLSERIQKTLPQNFPNFATQSKRQMKDVEFIATLLLFIEIGEKSFSQNELDKAFADRDDEWQEQARVLSEFEAALHATKSIVTGDGAEIASSRIKNQADFYSLFAALTELERESRCPSTEVAQRRLIDWTGKLKLAEQGDVDQKTYETEFAYLAAARAASNDAGPRRVRIDTVKGVLRGA